MSSRISQKDFETILNIFFDNFMVKISIIQDFEQILFYIVIAMSEFTRRFSSRCGFHWTKLKHLKTKTLFLKHFVFREYPRVVFFNLEHSGVYHQSAGATGGGPNSEYFVNRERI